MPRPFESADKDRDGRLSFEEFSQIPRIGELEEEKRRKLFSRFDKNGDGKIGSGEFERRKPESPFRRLWELDDDKSGGVSLAEFRKGEFVAKLPGDRQEEIFKRLDQDGDGQITAKDRPKDGRNRVDFRRLRRLLDSRGGSGIDLEAFRNTPMGEGGDRESEKRFRKLDRDGDGAITLRDLPSEGQPHRPHRSAPDFDSLDTDHDGSIGFPEFRAMFDEKDLTEDEQEDRFENLDENGDKLLSKEEFATFHPGEKKRRGKRGNPASNDRGHPQEMME